MNENEKIEVFAKADGMVCRRADATGASRAKGQGR